MRGQGWRWGLLAIVAGAALSAPLAGPAAAGDKDYFFPEVKIDATILPDGSLQLVEQRTFDFDGSFSYAFFTIDWDAGLIQNFEVVGDPGSSPVTFATAPDFSTGGFKGTWYFSAENERKTFTISYVARCAVDVYQDTAHLLWKFIGEGWDKRTEHASVTVHVPEKVTDVRRQSEPCGPQNLFGGVTNDKFSSSVQPVVQPLQPGDVRAWGHGPLGGEVRIPDPETVTLEVSDLPPGIFVEGSILFPVESVPFSFRQPTAKRAEILREEGALATEANRLREAFYRNRKVARIGTFVIPLLFLGLVLLARRRDRVPGIPRHLQEPPEYMHPVQLAYAWAAYKGDRTPKSAYRTQLLHLANANAIEIAPVGLVSAPEDFSVRRLRQPQDELDREFLEFLFAGDGKGPVNLKSVKAEGKRRSELREWGKALQNKTETNVKKLTKARARPESWAMFLVVVGVLVWAFASGALAGGPGAAALGVAFVFACMIGAAVITYGGEKTVGGRIVGALIMAGVVGLFGLPIALPLLFAVGGIRLDWGLALVGVMLLAWFVALRYMPERLKPEDRARVQQWGAFRRFLKEFSSLPEAPAMAVIIWEKYLVYATALDVADEVEKQVRAVIPPEELEELDAPFQGMSPGTNSLIWMHSFNQASAPSSVHAAFVTQSSGSFSSGGGSFSSGGGGGGGFSGGGGGGGGGTGGGAG